MKHTFVQILKSLTILVLLLMIPLFVESISKKSTPELQKAITVQAANTSSDESDSEITAPKSTTSNFVTQSNIQRLGLYTLFVLFIISVISFIKFKIVKDLHEQQ